MLKLVSGSGLLVIFALGGCAGVPCGDPHAYRATNVGSPLKAPAGLSVPTADSAYAIPGESTDKQADLDASGACLIQPPQLVTPQSSVNPKPATSTPPSVPAKPAAASTRATPAVASGGPIG